ncbi:RNA dependent RNA polymerase-domain-containing protein [Dendryphion nanum]|uniref:RNA-dependent RNA polymerase n=1 Tax=Dendryphion nanum TaxID=256645 RepID=A0A9P9ILM0_9PLEO|nr:RNA dependent RNA polymerase-domain-containing protein [Dendryphion nanum]
MIQEPLKNHKDTAFIDIGRWTTYRFSFDSSKLNSARWAIMRNALSDHNIDIVARTDLVFQPKRVAPIWNLLQDEFSSYHSGNEENQSAFEDLAADQCSLAFPVRYQLEACLTNGYLKEHSITSSFLNRLAQLEVDHATRILEKIADRQQVLYNPDQVFQIHVKGKMSRNVPTYCTLSRSVTITPTMLHVNTPVVETSNRITRKHAADADRFIRVKFTDEKTEGRLGSQTDDRSNAVFNRISRAMERGVIVAGRHYVFLAFGNSQFREHGAYFYAPTSSTSAENIRSTMGCFDHIKVVAKKGARIGQCLSTTRSIHVVNDIKVEEIADIERNGYTFSDGVGKLSRFLAQMSAQQLGIHNAFDDPPSLFQFRMDGCKGVLVLDPALKNNIVQIRPSQKKFTTTKKGLLEIIRASAFATACFNRQLIIILSTLGVSDEIFIRKQQEMVNSLERATIEETIAIKKLQQNIDYNGSTLKMVAMILDGFMKAKEPFMMSLLQLWRAYNIKYLKEKARIMIEEGAFVLGCIDETATLKGHFDEPQCRSTATRNEKLGTLPEIFLQITDPTSKSQYKVIEGVCVLARNPSLHAGDVRVVRAVDVPALHHLRNVVVLPQTGDRDVANMCSGGDLDGDDYLVLWDKEFIPKSINEVPMDFTPEKPQELDREVTIKDISDFFVTYIKNDSLARIALAHLAQADINEEGVRDETCIQLAQLHSQAVDYPKSGIPAIMDRGLKPRRYPHFMESKYRTKDQVYRSKKILGRLFDEVELVGFKPQYENKFDARILEAFELDKAWLAKAASIKDAYDESMKRLMAKHAIRTEFEAWVVFVLSHNQESRDYTFAEDFGRSVDLLKTQYKEICINASKEGSGLPRFVAAMYTVTAQQVTDAVEECQHTVIVDGREEKREMTSETMPLMSFPWLFASELGKIATKSGPTE